MLTVACFFIVYYIPYFILNVRCFYASLPQLLRTEAWLIIVSQDQEIMRGAVWVWRGDETAWQQAHHIQDGVALGAVLMSTTWSWNVCAPVSV